VKRGELLGYATGDYTMQKIVEHFKVRYATVSRAIRQAEDLED
jgi:predicted DNA-binding protein YlxM (UPF0122 family)